MYIRNTLNVHLLGIKLMTLALLESDLIQKYSDDIRNTMVLNTKIHVLQGISMKKI